MPDQLRSRRLTVENLGPIISCVGLECVGQELSELGPLIFIELGFRSGFPFWRECRGQSPDDILYELFVELGL
jgi:hypothetical protein